MLPPRRPSARRIRPGERSRSPRARSRPRPPKARAKPAPCVRPDPRPAGLAQCRIRLHQADLSIRRRDRSNRSLTSVRPAGRRPRRPPGPISLPWHRPSRPSQPQQAGRPRIPCLQRKRQARPNRKQLRPRYCRRLPEWPNRTQRQYPDSRQMPVPLNRSRRPGSSSQPGREPNRPCRSDRMQGVSKRRL